MSMRKVSVTATATFEFEIDDQARSAWDGSKILDVLRNRTTAEFLAANDPCYTEDATMDTLLGHLGIMLAIENRPMGAFDGWGDFNRDDAKGSPYSVDWTIENVEVS
jgi:hypothetical protein